MEKFRESFRKEKREEWFVLIIYFHIYATAHNLTIILDQTNVTEMFKI